MLLLGLSTGYLTFFSFLFYSKSMDTAFRNRIIDKGADIISALLQVAVTRPSKYVPEAKEETTPSTAATGTPPAVSSSIALPTSDETTVELRRRLAKELYRIEMDLAAGLLIAGKPCDCLSNKHSLGIEAMCEELISQDPGNASVYQEVMGWFTKNSSKVNPAAILSGIYKAEYPHMANEFKVFRKRVMGSVGETSVQTRPGLQLDTYSVSGEGITLAQAKRMAAEEAEKAVEAAWPKET
jgi:hypothetical protein